MMTFIAHYLLLPLAFHLEAIGGNPLLAIPTIAWIAAWGFIPWTSKRLAQALTNK